MLGKIKKIQAEVSEKILNSSYFITILHTNSRNTFEHIFRPGKSLNFGGWRVKMAMY
jgi:hypothetical protein